MSKFCPRSAFSFFGLFFWFSFKLRDIINTLRNSHVHPHPVLPVRTNHDIVVSTHLRVRLLLRRHHCCRPPRVLHHLLDSPTGTMPFHFKCTSTLAPVMSTAPARVRSGLIVSEETDEASCVPFRGEWPSPLLLLGTAYS